MRTYLLILVSFAHLASIPARSRAWPDHRAPNQSQLDPAFFGTWKVRPDKALTKLIFTMEGESFKAAYGPDFYVFRFDGKGYSMSNDFYTVVWRRIDRQAFESTIKEYGAIVVTTAISVSADGQSMKLTSTFKNARVTTVTMYQKVSGGSLSEPLIGTWQLPDTAGYGAVTLEAVSHGIRFSGNFGASYTSTFDNRALPVPRSNYRPGTTVISNVINEHLYEETWRRNGDPFARSRFELSRDGTLLTQTWTNLPAWARSEKPRVVTYGK